MDAIRAFGEHTFASLKIRNYRLYFIGIGFSHIGTWMQTVALGWLVLELTGSGTYLGVMLAFRFAPLLLGGLYAGRLVDKYDKRYLLYATQTVSATLAFILSALVFSGAIDMWMVYIAALLFGCADVVDRPARQTFIHEIVGSDFLRNAVALNAVEGNLARTLGPLFAGILIATVGTALCFFANALSFIVLIIFLALMREGELHREEKEERKVEGLLDGVRYAASVPLLRTILLSIAVIGTLTYEFQTSLPLFAHTTFLGGAADYAALLSAMGAGSVAGGLFSASRKDVSAHEFALWAFLFGISIVITSIMPSLGLATVGMVFVGFFSVTMSSTGNTMIQLESAPHMRGRVMSLWSMGNFGSTLIGAPIIGLIGEYISPRAALALGGLAAILAAVFAARLLEDSKFFSIPEIFAIRREEATVEDTKV